MNTKRLMLVAAIVVLSGFPMQYTAWNGALDVDGPRASKNDVGAFAQTQTMGVGQSRVIYRDQCENCR